MTAVAARGLSLSGAHDLARQKPTVTHLHPQIGPCLQVLVKAYGTMCPAGVLLAIEVARGLEPGQEHGSFATRFWDEATCPIGRGTQECLLAMELDPTEATCGLRSSARNMKPQRPQQNRNLPTPATWHKAGERRPESSNMKHR